jgi:acyl-lipid omega-6 desaturase (Delta-12 desaturase)
LVSLRPSNAAGAAAFATCTFITLAGVWLSSRSGWLPWIAGQAGIAFAFVQWFAVLHECGHETLFRTRRLNAIAGHVAAACSLIPYAAWTRVHRRHHRWTGWQDVDPTAVALAPKPRGRFQRAVVNVCWKCWIPLFAVLYRTANYWHLPRLWTMFRGRRERMRIVRDASLLAGLYVTVAVAVGPLVVVRAIGAGVVLGLILQDTLLLSQHAHVPQQLSHGAAVAPFRAIEQEAFTRSLRLPAWLSTLLLHFDAHELHHMYPFVPGYRLGRVAYEPAHTVGWWTWVRASRRLDGDVLLFQNRTETGWEI